MALAAEYNYLPMPNMRLNQQEAMDIIVYIENESRWISTSQLNGDAVAVTNAWIREAVPPATVNAGYMMLVNTGAENVTLVNVQSDAFESIDIHEMASADGLMTMREIKGLVIPARGRVELAPGSKHLMMRNPRKDIVAGQKIEFTLNFESGSSQTVSVAVAPK